MKKILIVIVVLVLVLAGCLFIKELVRSSDDTKNNILVDKTKVEETSTDSDFISNTYYTEGGDSATVKYYKNDTAELNWTKGNYSNLKLNIAISASGARYENIEHNLVVWEHAGQLAIYKNENLIFQSVRSEK